jgi:lactate dehydrogenase-like 2-hydroxyacid dehydrogenase
MSKTPILVLTTIPADLRMRLGAEYDLVDRAAVAGSGADPSRFRIAVTTSMAGVDEATMASLPGLGLVACNGAGLDKIDLAAAARRGIAVAHTPDELTEDTADFAIALLYATARRTVEADRFVRAGRWTTERMQPSRRILGKTMGIVGLGRIGQAVARRAVGIGMTVAYNGRREKPGVSYAFEPDLGRLAERADMLVLSCAGGEATRNLVDAAILERLGPDGILINISRGSVVDEPALIAALQNGTIAAAGLDVFATEPAIDERFMAMENVVVQPHYASLTHETRAALVGRISADIASFLAGRPFYDAAARPAA